MAIIADTHLHLHPAYRAGRALIRLSQRLGGLAQAAGVPGAARAGFLAERAAQHDFADLRDGVSALEGVTVAPTPEGGALCLATPDAVLYLLAGRQIIAAERIEVLALAMEISVPDGLPAADTIERVLAAGGVPVLAWAPGKWWFARGRVIADLLRRFTPEQVLLGDTTLRPLGWGEPCLMRLARRRGYGVVAGADPLPFAGDERHMGTYGTWLPGELDPQRPVASAREALRQSRAGARLLGRRGDPLTVARRLWRNARARGVL